MNFYGDKIDKDPVTPRQVADKRTKENLRKAIRMALDVESSAIRRNTQSFNANRYAAIAQIEDYQQLKDEARRIKEAAIARLPQLLRQLEAAVTSRGGYFFLAKSGPEASEYITSVCQQHQAQRVIKAKSITSEEIKLNHFLERVGIEVAETDLAEFILQTADEQPSHIVAPAIHRSRTRISALFKEKFRTDLPLDTGEDLTKFARDILREKFLTADVGISGANVIAADSGTLLLVESEGNIRMTTQAPPVHIALAGIEKVVPGRADLSVFIELLAPSATGQPLTSYTSIIRPPLQISPFSFDGRPKKAREFHLVLIDNGRMAMREDPVLQEALYCIRCSACLNACANFQAVGGHAFGGETYSGGIGGSWEAGTGDLASANFSELCSGCSRCLPQCPVKIDIPRLNENLRFRLNAKNKPGALFFIYKGFLPVEKGEECTSLQKRFFANFYVTAKWGSRFAPLSNRVANLKWARILIEKLFGVDRRRRLPVFYRDTLIKRFNRGKYLPKLPFQKTRRGKALLFADVYTNYSRPQAGIAAAKILQAFGVDTAVSDVVAEGRAALSQGMLATTARQAKMTASYLAKFIDDGYEIVVVEPSALALFRHDYDHFLNDPALFQKLKNSSFDAVEFLWQLINKQSIKLRTFFDIETISIHPPVFFHSHCQQRSFNAAKPTRQLLDALGFKVIVSTVECCGMAGSFGYKKDFYEISMRVGEDLLRQIEKARAEHGELTLLAGGISCFEQIKALTGKDVLHPLELLTTHLLPPFD